jgi:hypothetical protein
MGLAVSLPDVFDRFEEGAARVSKKDLDALTTSENLQGLTPVFSELHLVRSENGQVVLETGSGPLAEVLGRIENRFSYGEIASGRSLADHFAGEPYGWEFDTVRLFVLALLRAGKVQMTSGGQLIESAVSIEARNVFGNNNLFRQTTFQPKKGLDFPQVVEASESFKDTFGRSVAELEQGAVAREIREEVERCEDAVRQAHSLLASNALPGEEVLGEALSQMGAIRRSAESQVILAFNASHKNLKEAIKRAAELNQAVTAPHIEDLNRARRALTDRWPFLESESDVGEAERQHASKLEDILQRETFFRDLPELDQHARALEQAFEKGVATSERPGSPGAGVAGRA